MLYIFECIYIVEWYIVYLYEIHAESTTKSCKAHNGITANKKLSALSCQPRLVLAKIMDATHSNLIKHRHVALQLASIKAI